MNYVKMIRSLDMIYEKLTAVRKIKTHIKRNMGNKSIAEILKDFGITIKENESFDLNEIVDTMAQSQIKKKKFIHPSHDEPHENELSPEEVAFIESLNINFKNPTQADLNYLKESIELLREDYARIVKYLDVYYKDGKVVAETPEGDIDLTTDVRTSQEEAIEYLKQLDNDDSTEDIVDTYVTLFYTSRKLKLPHEKDEREKEFEEELSKYSYKEQRELIKAIEKKFGVEIAIRLGAKGKEYLCPHIKNLERILAEVKKLLANAQKMYRQKLLMMQQFNPHGFGKVFKAVANRQLQSELAGIPKHLEKEMAEYQKMFEYLTYYYETTVRPYSSELQPILNQFLYARSNNSIRESDPERFNELMTEIGQCLSDIEYYGFSIRSNNFENLRMVPTSFVNYIERNNMEVRLDMLNYAIREYKENRMEEAFEKTAQLELEMEAKKTPQRSQRTLR